MSRSTRKADGGVLAKPAKKTEPRPPYSLVYCQTEKIPKVVLSSCVPENAKINATILVPLTDNGRETLNPPKRIKATLLAFGHSINFLNRIVLDINGKIADPNLDNETKPTRSSKRKQLSKTEEEEKLKHIKMMNDNVNDLPSIMSSSPANTAFSNERDSQLSHSNNILQKQAVVSTCSSSNNQSAPEHTTHHAPQPDVSLPNCTSSNNQSVLQVAEHTTHHALQPCVSLPTRARTNNQNVLEVAENTMLHAQQPSRLNSTIYITPPPLQSTSASPSLLPSANASDDSSDQAIATVNDQSVVHPEKSPGHHVPHQAQQPGSSSNVIIPQLLEKENMPPMPTHSTPTIYLPVQGFRPHSTLNFGMRGGLNFGMRGGVRKRGLQTFTPNERVNIPDLECYINNPDKTLLVETQSRVFVWKSDWINIPTVVPRMKNTPPRQKKPTEGPIGAVFPNELVRRLLKILIPEEHMMYLTGSTIPNPIYMAIKDFTNNRLSIKCKLDDTQIISYITDYHKTLKRRAV